MSTTVQAEQEQGRSLTSEIKRLKVTEAKLAWELQEMKGIASAREAGSVRENAQERERMMMQSIMESQRATEEIDVPFAHSQHEAVPLKQKIVELERVKAVLVKLEEIKQLENIEAKLTRELREINEVPSAQQMATVEAGLSGDLLHRFMGQQMARKRERMMMQRAALESLNNAEGLMTGTTPSLTQQSVELKRLEAAMAQLKQQEAADSENITTLMPVAQPAAAGSSGAISGKMTDVAGTGISGNIAVYDASNGSWVANGFANSDGSYTIGSLPTGSYKVGFYPYGNYLSEWYNDKSSMETADSVSVTAPNTTVNIDAVLAESGSISGKITDAAGTGIAVYVSITVYDAFSGSWVANGYANSDGSYTIYGLPTGSYKVNFSPDGNYLSEWYNDKSSISTADVVAVTAPDTTANIDAVLVEGGSISGKMTDTAGVGVVGYVYAYDASSGSQVANGYANADGSYTIYGLPTGSYKVNFSPDGNYLSEWYNDKSSFSTADAVSVTTPNTTANIDAVLAPAGSISGKMTDTAGVGVVGYVSVYDASSGSQVASNSAYLDGSYTIGGLPTGSYKVYFSSSSFSGSGNYISEWYNDKSSLSTADAVSVTAPNTTANIDAVLAKAGSISGKMTDAAGVGFAGYVYAYNASNGSFVTNGYAGSDGSYTIGGLPTGSYKVYFTPQDNQKYIGEWYNNKSSMETADSVSVTAPNTTANINATLERTGSISGKVTDAKGAGVVGGYVYAYGVSSYSYSSSAQTQQDGSYIITGLPAGRYKIFFSPADNDYVIGEWYNGTSFNCSDWVTVTSAKTTANINAVLAPAGTISGKMTDAVGAGITGYIEVYNASSGSWVASGSTETDGSYTIGGLPAGSYKVEFSPNGNYLGEWYNNKSSRGTADSVSVTELKTTANINAVLAQGGSISGKMTNAAGAGLAGNVVVYNASSGYEAGYSYTSDGSYIVGGLPTGSYKVEFYPYGSYFGEWYSDKYSFDTAAAVSVTAPNTTANINAVLAEGGSISGKITDAAGTEVSGRVVVYDLDGRGIRSAHASADGSYKVDGLRTGSYKIRFSDYAGRYASEWYNDKNSLATAEAVAVTAPNTTSNINAVLAQGGSISGKMTTPDGVGIYDGLIFAYPSDDKTVGAGYSWTNGEGGYVISGLKTGTYKVHFNPYSNSCSDGKPYVDEWYNNRSSFSSADLVQVTSPNTTSGVNAAVDIFKGGIVIPIIINTLLQ